MLDLSGAHGAAAAANAITSNRFSYSMNLKVGEIDPVAVVLLFWDLLGYVRIPFL